ncbi:bacteriohemerythrin [Anaerosporobacter faecicola]|uniref:bacteriohemerythrin n=1 Tax=Anaerosporobacter faecicola TaxID=2718714 RepID=UPI0014388937|nr:hemerythrin family protein [Anaerosporobacter faecicola]
MYEMKEEYLTGIEMIDNEHRTLFEICEEAYQLKNNDFIADKYDELHAILHRLKDYTIKHFNDEEAYMESISYKRMFTQKVQHNAFKEKLEAYDIDGIDENTEYVIDDILNYLTDWLIEHILENDVLIAQQ